MLPLKGTETRGELSTKCNPKVMSRCLSVYIPTSLPQEQPPKTNLASMVRILMCTVKDGVANTSI